MRLETAMNASRSGLDAHGGAIAVIGDNISNSNTTGYKNSRVEFGDLLPDGGESARSNLVGGGGSGVQVQAVRTIFNDGILESTGRALDMGIGGSGFFMIGDAAAPDFTRAGNFAVDGEGFLVTADGQQVLGIPEGGAELGGLNIANVDINGAATTAAVMTGNIDSRAALTAVPENPESFNELAAAASFASTLEVFDTLGESHTVQVMYFKTDVNTFEARAYIDQSETGGTAGTPQQLGTATLNFNNNGAIEEANQAAAQMLLSPAYANGAAAGAINMDLSTFTQFATTNSLSTTNQNGLGTGNIVNYEVTSDGVLSAVLDNGTREPIGTLQLATFNNLDALTRAGSNAFKLGAGSGDRIDGAPGGSGFGVVQGGALERSTVDISTEFVTLVVFQRGYQANSQALNAASGLLRETIALLR